MSNDKKCIHADDPGVSACAGPVTHWTYMGREVGNLCELHAREVRDNLEITRVKRTEPPDGLER